MDDQPRNWLAVDVGSTTVKCLVASARTFQPSHVQYERHHGDLVGTVARLVEKAFEPGEMLRPVLTGSGARVIADRLGAPVIHEVSAVTAAVEAMHPSARAVFELGGQDAKAMWFERDAGGRAVRVGTSMNERCAAGTGVTIDRCIVRLGVAPETLPGFSYQPAHVRALSSKCGVFAETDAVNLARSGVPTAEIVASLADAIVIGNLAVLARGTELRPDVVLLGGPVVFFPALASAFRHHLARLWRSRGIARPACEGGVSVPVDALIYAALGAVRVASERATQSEARSLGEIMAALYRGGAAQESLRCDVALAGSESEADSFARVRASITPAWPASRGVASLTLGIDAGSTVTKGVVIDGSGRIVASAFRRSGDPVADARGLLTALEARLAAECPGRSIDRIGVTGYGAAVIGPIVGADVSVLETVAHAAAARAVVPDADVVCDIGGQDIKVLMLDEQGAIRDFRISSQCSAGIGMVLESTALEFGIPLDRYAEHAFNARRAPYFAESCVVFLDSNRVAFQRDGFSPDEILAGLARALPRVVWAHVMAGISPGQLGSSFVLQGGVQHNLAAVKTQYDHLRSAVPGARVFVHPYPSDAGALGAAHIAQCSAGLEVTRVRPLVAAISVNSDESTKCGLCPNHCARTFIEVTTTTGAREIRIAGNGCEAGATADATLAQVRAIPARRAREIPNLLADEARLLFARGEAGRQLLEHPRRIRIGIPRTLAMYRAAPFFRGYLQTLGVRPRDVVFSPVTSDELFRAGAHHGATDPCFPVKATLAHVHHLLERVHRGREPLDALFVPRVTDAATPVRHAVGCASCPVVAAAPAMVRAAFATDPAFSGADPLRYIDASVNLARIEVLREQLFDAFSPLLGMSRSQSDVAVDEGLARSRRLDSLLQTRARAVLAELDQDTARHGSQRGAVLVISRPYHADPGICHRVGEEIQALGYPVLTIRSLPRDPPFVGALFRREIERRVMEDPFDIRDLLPESDNSGSGERLWAARYASAHGALGVVDLSSFKCAQDAPTYGPMRKLFDAANVCTLRLHDLDETRPAVSLRLRLRTFAHAMRERGLRPWSSSAE